MLIDAGGDGLRTFGLPPYTKETLANRKSEVRPLPLVLLLRITGTLDVMQFWPHGVSDADTLTVRVATDGFRLHEGRRTVTTRVLDHARVVGRGAHPVLRGDRHMTVRLQGVDAPELHYAPPVAPGIGAPRFRQPFAERSASALGARLAAVGRRHVPCVVETRVESPGDAFDVYGRCVGELFVGMGAERVHVNDWLLRRGLAFPSLFSSMARDEIERVLAGAHAARVARRGVWRALAATLVQPAWSRVFHPGSTRLDRDDRGRLNEPRIFRWLAAWTAARRAKVTARTFEAFLATRNDDMVHTTEAFLADGAAAARVVSPATFVRRGRVAYAPGEVVYREAPAMVVRGDGRRVQRW